MSKIIKIEEGSLAEELELEIGDQLLSINQLPVEDIIDYIFLMNDEYVEIEIEKANGDIWELEVDKEYDETLGVEFDRAIIDDAKRCHNNCVFCFVDQLPKGMRESLYFKDDDSRLSFLQGNFVTLTNLNDEKLDRIVRYKISPINVSVHTTNPELRMKMLNNRFAGNIMERLRFLTEGGIVVNAQIVLCPGYNDGEELKRTLKDLATLNEHLNSVAIVPIGLTKHRDHLTFMEGFNRQTAQAVIQEVEAFQEQMLKTRGTRFVFLADEFYIIGNQAFPSHEAYEGFLQYEDGVGMVRKLTYEVHEAMKSIDLKEITYEKRHVVIATGVAAGPYLKGLAREIEARFTNLKVDVQAIKNDFFGEKITVAGLLTGTDIKAQLKVDETIDEILLPIYMFRTGEEVLLDDCTKTELEAYFKKPIGVVDGTGLSFIRQIVLGGNNE